jgi:hypothetical protein
LLLAALAEVAQALLSKAASAIDDSMSPSSESPGGRRPSESRAQTSW